MLRGHLQTRGISWTPMKTPIGTIYIIWGIINKPIIFKVILPDTPGYDRLTRISPESRLPLKTVKIENLALDLYSKFQRRVLITVYRIPSGFVSTYGDIARKLSTSPRSIGQALSTNPFPIIIPCHRIVKSDRSLGGYQGGEWMKKRLLESEGIKFDKNNKIYDDIILREGVKN